MLPDNPLFDIKAEEVKATSPKIDNSQSDNNQVINVCKDLPIL